MVASSEPEAIGSIGLDAPGWQVAVSGGPERRGLSSAEAAERRARNGPNELPRPRRVTLWRRLGAQLVHFFAFMLWCASGLAFVAGLPALGIAIAIVVVVNAVFAAFQQHRADQAAERLSELLPMRVTVRRDGNRLRVDAADVVVGDVLVLESGDRIPADAHVVLADALLVDTSLLTGESDAVSVERDGPLWAGCFVVEGLAEAIVTSTGGSTRLAKIAILTTATERPATPLTVELARVVRTIAAIAVGVGAGFFSLAVLLGERPSDGFVFAIGVTVALVPEALLPTVTLSLAWGAQQLARRHVLVRSLDAVETLGSTTFVCTDKTGTLTRNQMTVVEAWTPSGTATASEPGYDPAETVTLSSTEARDDMARLALAASRSSTGYVWRDDNGVWRAHGDPMEAALDAFARRVGLDTDRDRTEVPVARRFPFDARRRRMSAVVDGFVAVKGASDAVLPRCADDRGAAAVASAFAARGLRVLAVAGRRIGQLAPPTSAEAAESGLELYGLVALEDPPRTDVSEAIRDCRRAGVKLAMVTGDHPETAAAIAREVGLHTPGAPVVTGADLPADDDALGRLIDHDGVVIARVSPEDKVRIARALRMRGHVVAMTGDGVNDGPALHEADIGIAMGASGTDVAREAADLVLLDDHFGTIVGAIEQGRATFLNIRRFLTYHLTDNVAELTPFVIWALSGGRIPLALTVLQILALDIGTDTLSATALGAEPPHGDLLNRAPVSGRLLSRAVLRRAFGVLGVTIATVTMAAFFASFISAGWWPGESFPGGHVAAAASGAAFMAVVATQTANAFACRSTARRPGELGWATNRLLIPAAAIEAALSIVLLFASPIARQLEHANPPLVGWLVALSGPLVLLAVDALDKRVARR
jgi:calcium-translocating P-type ATPase